MDLLERDAADDSPPLPHERRGAGPVRSTAAAVPEPLVDSGLMRVSAAGAR